MKPELQTGNLINHIESLAVGQPEPEVDMGATILHWTDRTPGTIIEVFKVGAMTYITVQDDDYKVVKGSMQDGTAEYEFSQNPNAAQGSFRREESGQWTPVRKDMATGLWNKVDGSGVRIGAREMYRDPET